MHTPSTPLDPDEERFTQYSGIVDPDRSTRIDVHGVELAVHEWGDATAPPILLAHGGFDFALTFSRFAPLLAAAGYRIVSWDQRGHGDSGQPALYSFEADLRDALGVLDSIGREPIPFIGHSKGGSLLTRLALALPHRVSRLVSIDGLPSRRAHPDVADHERTRLLTRDLDGWLAHRRRASTYIRKTGTLEDLARRRGRMNPRLEHEWLCFLVTRGARKSDEGWRWKIDPSLRFGGFGPWRPQWALEMLPGLAPPLLGLLAGEREPMGFDSRKEDLAPYVPRGTKLECFEGVGHFMHIEKPRAVADRILEFLKS